MNDFNFDGVDYTKPSFKAVLGASTDVPSSAIGQTAKPLAQNYNIQIPLAKSHCW